MKYSLWKTGIVFLAVVCSTAIQARSQTRVVLDNYYNHEFLGNTGKLYHYLWSDSANSGFSEWGGIFVKAGAKIDTLQSAPRTVSLQKADIYVIVDPDTKAETPNPHYLEKKGIDVITRWVKAGGVLVLMANDSGNCEFQHLNDLAKNFGLHFNEVRLSHVEGTDWDMGGITELPASPVFAGVHKIYMKDVSSLSLTNPAQPVLTKDGAVFMAISHVGKGYVFAVTDPWIYNEYIGHRQLPESFDNYRAAENLANYLLALSKKARQ